LARDREVDVLPEPKFEGRNHLVSEEGEPIDPFEIEVRTRGGDAFGRRVLGIPVNEMTPLQRRGTGRYPISVTLSNEAMLANMAVLRRHEGGFGFDTPLEYTQDRIARLKGDLGRLNNRSDATDKERAELAFRLRSLDEGLRANLQPDARPIRWTRYFFDAQYRHLVSGVVRSALGSLRSQFEIVDGANTPSGLLEYNLGFFDTDAMTMIVRGSLSAPVRVKLSL
jgi:hypothetical protein